MMGENEKKRRGRPLKDGARRHSIKTLFSENELELMNEASEKYGVTRSDIIRGGVSLYISELADKFPDSDDDYPWDEDWLNYSYEDDLDEEEDCNY